MRLYIFDLLRIIGADTSIFICSLLDMVSNNLCWLMILDWLVDSDSNVK